MIDLNNYSELISVIVPVYNVEKYIRRCVDSILSQTYSKIEIILVDDGSTDSSGIICDQYADENENVAVIHKKNGGLSSARNAGLDVANGKYIGFVDSDDWIKNTMYSNLLLGLINTGSQCSTCGVLISDGIHSKKYDSIGNKKIFSRNDAIIEILMERNIDVSACNKLYQANLFNGIRYPVGENNEDAAIILDILDRITSIVHVGTDEYFYFQRANSISNTISKNNLINQYEHAIKMHSHVRERYPQLAEYSEFYIYMQLISIERKIIKMRKNKELYGMYIQYYKTLKEYDTKRNRKRLSHKRYVLLILLKLFWHLWL